jgi:glycosyltransferase involved in cell wall biosynthesis
MLGFGETSEKKIGSPPKWIKTFADQSELSQRDFYRQCDIILQPSDTTENWPRVGLEAMASGAVLIVDNRGGWRQMVDHGVTGWLCDDDHDFVRFGTRMATNRGERQAISAAARNRLPHIAGESVSGQSWRSVLKKLNLVAARTSSQTTVP